MFDDIIGNEKVKKYLKAAIENKRLSNTLLFSGQDGIGKMLFAKEVALHLMYEKLENKKKFHPDLHILKPYGKMYLHLTDSIKNMIKDVFMQPLEAKRKVFIVQDANRMLPSVANSLLKTLEEPNLNSYIILITNQIEDILPTILSRCFHIKFFSLNEKEMKSVLKKWGKTDKEILKIIALSKGSLSKAMEISSFVDLEEKTEILLKILLEKNISFFQLENYLKQLEELFGDLKNEDLEKYYKEIDLFFDYILMFYRDLYILKNNISKKYLFFVDKEDLLQKRRKEYFLPLEKVISILKETKSAFFLNTTLKTVLEELFFRLNSSISIN